MMNKPVETIAREKVEQTRMVEEFLANGGVIQQIAPTAWDEEAERPRAAPRVIGV
jgi:hypothetical protein|tara:strand:+ start:363 stop:527 length:165 start_codon:yes stop_codon:yes gene_type:complete